MKDIYILTTSDEVVGVQVSSTESKLGDLAVMAELRLKLKKRLSTASFTEQNEYLSTAAVAAFVSLNALDQDQRYNAMVDLITQENTVNFLQGSSSSGLGFALSIFSCWWQVNLNKKSDYGHPVFATGEVLNSGKVLAVDFVEKKIRAACEYVRKNLHDKSRFYICYPASNASDVTKILRDEVESLGGKLVAANTIPDFLGVLLGDAYDGKNLGRWRPFKGLSSFEYKDNVRFFGRDGEVQRLFNELEKNNGLLIISGASGTGKSSLINAGLIPYAETTYGNVYWSVTSPVGSDDEGGLIVWIINQLSMCWGGNLESLPITQENQWTIESINDFVELLKSNVQSRKKHCLLFIDQFEELFNDESRSVEGIEKIISIINILTAQISKLDIVLSLRQEYIKKITDNTVIDYKHITSITESISHDNWLEIVTKQAKFSGLSFEKNELGNTFDQEIVKEAQSTNFALPMVEFLLDQLYKMVVESDSDQTVLKYKDYKFLGGISGSVTHRAVLATNDIPQDTVDLLFEIFVGLNGDGLPFSRNIKSSYLANLNKEIQDLVEILVEANLIISKNLTNEEEVFSLSHDSLFKFWGQLNHWIDTNNEYLLWMNLIDAQYQLWITGKISGKTNKKHLLHSPTLLSKGCQYIKSHTIKNSSIVDYIKQSKSRSYFKKFTYGLTSFFIFTLFLGGYAWEKNLVTSKYYSNIGSKNLIPFGINELSNAKISNRELRYKLDYRDGELIKLSIVNGSGFPTMSEPYMNKSQREYIYSTSGNIIEMTNKSYSGRIISKHFYKNYDKYIQENIHVVADKDNINQKSNFLNKNKSINGNAHSNTKYEISEEGVISTEIYLDAYGNKTLNMDGKYGIAYIYNKKGFVKSQRNINELENEDLENNKLEYEYDKHGSVIEQKWYEKGTLVKRDVYRLDDYGNKIEILNEYNEGVNTNNVYSTKKKIDVKGNVINVSFYDKEGVLVERDSGVAKLIRKFNENGWYIEEKYKNKHNEHTWNSMGIKSIYRGYDEIGNSILEMACGIKNIISFEYVDPNKCVVMQNTYDSDSNLTALSYFESDFKSDTDETIENININKNKILVGSAHKYSYLYSEEGVFNGISAYDMAGNLVTVGMIDSPNITTMKFKLDDYGRIIEQKHFDNYGKLTGDDEGVAIFKSRYDLQGNVVETSNFDKNNYPVAVENVFITKYLYDKRGRQVERSFYDINNEPTMDNIDQAHKVIIKYKGNTEVELSRSKINTVNELIFPFYEKNIAMANKNGRCESTKEIKKSLFNIITIPKNVKISLNNQFIGITPMNINLDVGAYYLKAELDGYIPQDRVFYHSPTSTQVINIDFTNKKTNQYTFEQIKNNAKAGKVEFQYKLGLRYEFNIDDNDHINKALYWYELAAKNGSAMAMVQMANIYTMGGGGVQIDFSKANIWYEKAIKKGSISAKYNLAISYYYGTGVEKNHKKAFDLFESAANDGLFNAQDRVAFFYALALSPIIGRPDYLTAIKWFEKALTGDEKNKLAEVAYSLGNMYFREDNPAKDCKLGFEWHKVASFMGNAEAYGRLGSLYLGGVGTKPDVKEAINWLRKSSDSKDNLSKIAESELCSIYFNGIGIPVDFEKAFEWCNRSLKNGYFNSNLISMYSWGQGVKKDIKKARELAEIEYGKEYVRNDENLMADFEEPKKLIKLIPNLLSF